MTWRKREIMDMARESHMDVYGLAKDHEKFVAALEKFAKLVLMNTDPASFMSWQEGYEAGKLIERETCAKFVDHILKEGGGTWGEAIRARGQT